MINLDDLDRSDFLDISKDIVPKFQYKSIEEVILSNDISLIEKKGQEFLGEDQYRSPDWNLTGTNNSNPRNDNVVWKSIKLELHDLFCTDSEKYKDIRGIGDAKSYVRAGITYVVGVVAGLLGLLSSAVIGAVTLAFYAASRIGLNAWCRINSEAS